MRTILSTALILLLAGCGRSGPVDDDATAPPANITGEALPPAGAAEAHDRAALPLPTDGLRWRAGANGWVYGGEAAPPLLSFSCEGPRLMVRRHAAAPDGGKGTLSVTGGGEGASMPVRAAPDAQTAGGRGWLGEADRDTKTDVARVMGHAGPVEVTVGGAPDLVVPGSDALGRAMRCGA